MRLLLIRHGQTPANVAHRLDTAVPGPGLTALGVRQAEQLPSILDGRSIDAIVASTLVRTQATAAPLARARRLDVPVRDGLQEIEAGTLEGRSDPESARAYLETVFAWANGDLDRPMPGGPDGRAFFSRFDRAITMIEDEGHDTAVVVSHGAAIRAWASTRAADLAPTFGADHPLDNTGIVELDGSMSTSWRLIDWAGLPVDGGAMTDMPADATADASAGDPTGETIADAREQVEHGR